MTRPIDITITPNDADADGICAAQAVAGAGDLTINGALAASGLATLDVPRHVVIDSSNAGDTTQTITVVGRDRNGNSQQEVISANGTTAVSSTLDFKEVTEVTASAAFTGNVTVGTTSTFSFPWVIYDRFSDHKASLQGIVTGTINWGVELTYEDPFADEYGRDWSASNPFNPDVEDHATLSSETTTQSGMITDRRPSAFRFKVNSFSSGASLRTLVQFERAE